MTASAKHPPRDYTRIECTTNKQPQPAEAATGEGEDYGAEPAVNVAFIFVGFVASYLTRPWVVLAIAIVAAALLFALT